MRGSFETKQCFERCFNLLSPGPPLRSLQQVVKLQNELSKLTKAQAEMGLEEGGDGCCEGPRGAVHPRHLATSSSGRFTWLES